MTSPHEDEPEATSDDPSARAEADETQLGPQASTKLERSSTRVRGFDDAEMDFQLIRQLGATPYGGASVGECLAVGRRIENGIPASWSAAFEDLARRQLADAQARESRGHRVSAREQYLKASNSFRAAEYYTPLTDAKHQQLGLESRAAFLASMRLQDDHTCEEIRLPFGDSWLPAYFLRPVVSDGSGKTIMIVSGYDGTMEECYFQGGRAGLERGYNVLLFAGPGQMDTMRFHPHLKFIPDFERAAAVAVDYALSRPEVNPDRLALLGISVGGYFCLRAAAFDPRIRAVIPNSPIIDYHAYMTSFAGFDFAEMPDEMDFDLVSMAYIPEEHMSAQVREMAASLILRFGQPTFKKTYQYFRSFRLGDALANIRCPALALVGSGEGDEPLRQYEAFLNGVSGPVTGYVFTESEGADSHCALGNLSFFAAVMYDWLDEVWGL